MTISIDRTVLIIKKSSLLKQTFSYLFAYILEFDMFIYMFCYLFNELMFNLRNE